MMMEKLSTLTLIGKWLIDSGLKRFGSDNSIARKPKKIEKDIKPLHLKWKATRAIDKGDFIL